ncbi:hypothetical protein ACIP4T_14840 [Streptomyces massasporeus]|uniref:hypothetical protein n=1 Tax=Streptomyces massasporeus TaxID=67324 RepID=UPI0036E0FD88
MTEVSGRRSIRRTLWYGGIALAAVLSTLLAYLLGVFSEERGDIKADDVCQSLPDRQAAARIFDSLLPRAAEYDFVTTSTPDPDESYINTCSVMGDNNQRLLNLHAEMGVAMPWRQWVDHNLPPTSGKVTYFDAGVKGVSTSDLAAIYVPCYSSEAKTKQPHNLTVFAHATEELPGSDSENRQNLVDLATAFGRNAYKEAECDLPSRLPD